MCVDSALVPMLWSPWGLPPPFFVDGLSTTALPCGGGDGPLPTRCTNAHQHVPVPLLFANHVMLTIRWSLPPTYQVLTLQRKSDPPAVCASLHLCKPPDRRPFLAPPRAALQVARTHTHKGHVLAYPSGNCRCLDVLTHVIQQTHTFSGRGKWAIFCPDAHSLENMVLPLTMLCKTCDLHPYPTLF